MSTRPGPDWTATTDYHLTLTREQRAATYAAWQARERHTEAPSQATAAEVERTERACLALGVTGDGAWVRTRK